MTSLFRFTEFFLLFSLIVLSLGSSTHGQTGIITTVAGNGNTCSSATSPCGDGGPATQAQLSFPSAVAVDIARHLFYIVDSHDQRVRRVDATTNIITAYAGNGNIGYSDGPLHCPNNGGPNPGDGGLATQACLNTPTGVAVDQNGNVYISDDGNSRIRRVDFKSKTISTYAGSGNYGYCGDGGLAVQACLASPLGLAWDSSSNSLYIADSANQRIRKVDGSGVISTVAGVGRSSCAETPVAVDTCLSDPEGVTVDGTGRFFYVADTQNLVIRQVDTGATPATQTIVAGKKDSSGGAPCPDGSPATGGCFFRPSGVGVDASGRIYIADREQTQIYLVSGGLIFVAAGNGSYGYCGDGGPATAACLSKATGVAIASASMYIADNFNQRIRMVNLGFALSVSLNGTSGGTVTSNPTGISCPGTCSGNFLSGSVVTLTAKALAGWIFSGWSGACTGTGTCTVSMTAAKSVQAVFRHILSVSVGGTGTGTVTSNPPGISCPGTCSAGFSGGTQVTLTPIAASGSTFAGWGGACSGAGGCTVTMNAAQSVTATFNTVCTAAASRDAAQLSSSCTPQLTVQQISLSKGAYIPIYRDQSGSAPLIPNSIYPPANPLNPAACPGGDKMQVDVTFSISPILPVALNNVTIVGTINRGSGIPAKLTKLNVQIPASQTFFTVYGITADLPFPAKTQHYKYMTIAWTYQIGSATPIPIGQTQHEVFVTLARPLPQSTVYLTTLQLAVVNGGAANSGTAFQNTWDFLKGLQLKTWDSRALHYYPNGVLSNSCPVNEYDLLTKSVGQCGAFAYLLMGALAANGIPSQAVAVNSGDQTWFLVNNWNFSGTGSLKPPSWPYEFKAYSRIPNLTCPLMPANGDLVSLDGLPGQNEPTPCEKAFFNHFIVRVSIALAGSGCTTGPCYYDPSYGKSYANANAFETGAVAGYMKPYGPLTNNIWQVEKAHGSLGWLHNIFFGYQLRVTFQGAGHGRVAANPPGWSCAQSCNPYAPIDATVTLTASPAAGSTFAGWAGCSPISAKSCTVTMSKAQSVTATFQ